LLKKLQDRPVWQVAAKTLMPFVERDGPVMMAEIRNLARAGSREASRGQYGGSIN